DSGLLEELEPPLQRGKELDLSSEHDPGMRIEGHDAGSQAGASCSLDDLNVAAVDAVEGAHRDSASGLGQVRGLACDVHTRSSTSASGRSRSGVNASGATASST